jgi:hypothetical protein
MDPDPKPDPTSFFINFKDAKKIIFFLHIFSYNLPMRNGKEGAGSVPLNNEYGSGSGRPKNMRIMRIPNIGTYGGGVGAGGPTQGQPTLHLWRHLQDIIHI